MKLISFVFLLNIILIQSAFSDYPNKFKLTSVPDLAHRVSKPIVAKVGGILETTDKFGNFYRLTIPANVLIEDLNIRMTPLSVSGIPGEAEHIGVDISPAGTKLYGFARLQIIAKNINQKDAYWLQTTGNILHPEATPAIASQDGDGALLTHFSGATLVKGNNQVSEGVHNGVFDNTLSWYEWQRNIVNQDFASKKIDDITYKNKIEIIESHSRELILELKEKEFQELVVKSKQAMERLEQEAKDPNVENTEKFIEDLNRVLEIDRIRLLLGLDLDVPKLSIPMSEYYGRLYKNCRKQPYSPKTILMMERIRQLEGGDPDLWTKEVDDCLFMPKIYKVSADYIYKNKSVKKLIHGVDNVSDNFSVQLKTTYFGPTKTFAVEIAETSDRAAKFDFDFQSPLPIGEGCEGTQKPIGTFDAFEISDKFEVSGSYFPEMDYPADMPLPPNMPHHQNASGGIQLKVYGKSVTPGWEITPMSQYCKGETVPPHEENGMMWFMFDQTKLDGDVTKIIEDHTSEDADHIGGWKFTYERLK
jgi:hypothetical protein